MERSKFQLVLLLNYRNASDVRDRVPLFNLHVPAVQRNLGMLVLCAYGNGKACVCVCECVVKRTFAAQLIRVQRIDAICKCEQRAAAATLHILQICQVRISASVVCVDDRC